MSEELTPMDRMELWMSAINEAIANGTENTYTPYDRHELWMKKICESILAKDPADPDVVQAFVEGWLEDHPGATTTVEDGAVTTAKLASGAVTTDKIAGKAVTRAKLADAVTAELDNKANIDGSYESMTVGNAEQLVSTVGVEDNAPYVFRTTGGSADVGDRMNLKAVIGGTVAWNQLVPNANITFTSDNTDTRALNFYFRRGVYPYTSLYNKSDVQTGILSSIVSASFDGYIQMVHAGAVRNMYYVPIETISVRNGHKYLFSLNITGTDVSTVGGVTAKDIQVYDLTAMFGSAIADYVYTLESGTAGAGIAWLKKYGWFTKPYYPYKAAALESVKTSAHKMIGFNAYNPSTGKAKVVGGMVYQITGAYTALSLDGTSITPDASGYFTPSANGELTVTGGNGTTTCIHLKWDGERDGEWEEFSEHTYALDDVELRGIPKKDANNNLYYDGDEYTPDGTVTRRYGVVTLDGTQGNPNASAFGGSANNAVARWVLGSPAKAISTTEVPSAMCDKLVPCNASNGGSFNTWKDNSSLVNTFTITADGDKVCIAIKETSITDNASLNAYLSSNPITIVYELATPTTESADAYTELQVCDDFGTEEFVDAATRDFEMPCGSNAVYQPNLRAKLEMAPNSPSNGNGDYIVRQTDGANEYVLFSEVKELPDVSAADAGKVATVDDSGVWGAQEPIGKKFIVTLTPTAQDFSGTMDKTVAEIDAAYNAGSKIVFKVLTSATSYVEVPVSFLGKDTSFDYPNFGAEIVRTDVNVMITAETVDTNDGTKQTYSTKTYTLTPAT